MELSHERTTHRATGIDELVVGAIRQVTSVLLSSSPSLSATSELLVTEAATNGHLTVLGVSRSKDSPRRVVLGALNLVRTSIQTALDANVSDGIVLHDVDYYVTFVVTCKLFLTKG